MIPSRPVALARRLYNRLSRGGGCRSRRLGLRFSGHDMLGHGLQIVPIVEQHRIPVVRDAVVDDDSRPAAAGAVVLFALAQRVLREIRDPQPLPAAAIDP